MTSETAKVTGWIADAYDAADRMRRWHPERADMMAAAIAEIEDERAKWADVLGNLWYHTSGNPTQQEA